MRSAHQSELCDVVQSSNHKYDEMLAERLACEEILKEEMNRMVAESRAREEAKVSP